MADLGGGLAYASGPYLPVDAQGLGLASHEAGKQPGAAATRSLLVRSTKHSRTCVTFQMGMHTGDTPQTAPSPAPTR